MSGPVPLAELTTLRVGGPGRRIVEVSDDEALMDAVASADASGDAVLLVAGGSNLLVDDGGVDADVVLVRTRGMRWEPDDRGSSGSPEAVLLTAAAGEPWDAVVAQALDRSLRGIEALSGIPGSVGATPVQNVGAYGQDIAQTLVSVRVWDRRAREERLFDRDECGFGYRHSRFKADPAGFVVLDVTLETRGRSGVGAGEYAELARTLGVEVGGVAPSVDVREAVLGLRRGKGMVLDDGDHDTWSAGSFFTNPVLPSAADVPDGAPTFPAAEGVKTSAAWLIEHSGFSKGFGLPGPASLSTKHTLALTNRGNASSDDLLALARTVRDGVRERFGITLVNEPVLVGCSL